MIEGGMQVEGLKDKQVNHVACGAWHTAAVAAPRPQGPDLVDKLPFIERLAVQHKLAAMYELTEEVSHLLSSIRSAERMQQEQYTVSCKDLLAAAHILKLSGLLGILHGYAKSQSLQLI